MAQLVILGHKTRSKEVIEILEMLGGKNSRDYVCNIPGYAYSIDEQGIIDLYISHSNSSITFTLEEFLERFPYKVGDKVHHIIDNENQIITNLIWDEDEDEVLYKTTNNFGYVYVNYLQPHKEETMEESIIDTIKESADRYRIKVNYQFDIEVDEGEYYAVRRKPQYPKTYEEGCKVLNLTKYPPALVPNKVGFITQYEDFPYYYEIQKLAELLVCRNAYWKIAGEQMGLGKPWEPDWKDGSLKYIILHDHNEICTDTFNCTANRILAFPTEEMRDAFYENFKKLIEWCKELL